MDNLLGVLDKKNAKNSCTKQSLNAVTCTFFSSTKFLHCKLTYAVTSFVTFLDLIL